MKKANISVAVLIIVGVVLGLGVLFVLSSSSSPTGYAGPGVPTGAVTAFVPQDTPCSSDADCSPPGTCQYYPGYGGYYCGDGCGSASCNSNSDCTGDFENECCDSEDSAFCVGGSCNCISPCEEADSCDPDPESGEEQCGGIFDGAPKPEPCQPTDQYGEGGGCDCGNKGCTSGAPCSTFGVLSHPFVNPCGPKGHCETTGSVDGTLFGICVCGEKPCELSSAEGFEGEPDQCEDTVQCDEGSTCKTHADCGGVGLGRCNNGICDCECASWAPCNPSNNFDGNFNNDCGSYGEGGNYGQCIVGSDGAAECMCTDDVGCSPLDCIPGVTPCSGDSQGCGGASNCEFPDDGGPGVCFYCGLDCELPCQSSSCDETPLTQEECDIVAQEIGSKCTVDTNDNECDCPGIPATICNGCYSSGDGFVGSCV